MIALLCWFLRASLEYCMSLMFVWILHVIMYATVVMFHSFHNSDDGQSYTVTKSIKIISSHCFDCESVYVIASRSDIWLFLKLFVFDFFPELIFHYHCKIILVLSFIYNFVNTRKYEFMMQENKRKEKEKRTDFILCWQYTQSKFDKLQSLKIGTCHICNNFQ